MKLGIGVAPAQLGEPDHQSTSFRCGAEQSRGHRSFSHERREPDEAPWFVLGPGPDDHRIGAPGRPGG